MRISIFNFALCATCTVFSQPLTAQNASAPINMKQMGIPSLRSEGACAARPIDLGAVVPVVEIIIDGKGPFRFAIDTGAQGHGRIKAEIAEALGMPIVGKAKTMAPGGTTEDRAIYGAPILQLGGVTFHNAQLVTMVTTRGPNVQWDGILGIDLFKDFTLSLDYGNKQIMLNRAPLRSGVKATPDHGILTIPVTIGNSNYLSHVDTGNGAMPMALTEADAKTVPLAGPPKERGKARTSFGEFSIMEATLSAPVKIGQTALLVDKVAWPSPRPINNLGSRGLTGMTLRIDQKNMLVDVQPSSVNLPSCMT